MDNPKKLAAQDTQDEKKTHNTILQITGGEDEPNIVLWEIVTDITTRSVKTHNRTTLQFGKYQYSPL